MKIYTKTGDDGSTGLIGGRRVGKDDPRIDCYGTVDELNAVIGLAGTECPDRIRDALLRIQAELFVIGSHLAAPDTTPAASKWVPALEPSMVDRMEQEIDNIESLLTPLQNFILPGGTETSARLHMARTVARRAERLVVQLSRSEAVDALLIRYLNRLSDWLFVHARLANHLEGVKDIPWVRK
jgi:cob(I)alamin adenosyltransferase